MRPSPFNLANWDFLVCGAVGGTHLDALYILQCQFFKDEIFKTFSASKGISFHIKADSPYLWILTWYYQTRLEFYHIYTLVCHFLKKTKKGGLKIAVWQKREIIRFNNLPKLPQFLLSGTRVISNYLCTVFLFWSQNDVASRTRRSDFSHTLATVIVLSSAPLRRLLLHPRISCYSEQNQPWVAKSPSLLAGWAASPHVHIWGHSPQWQPDHKLHFKINSLV